jgi:hypothetical protein
MTVINSYARSINRAGDCLKKTKSIIRAHYRKLSKDDKLDWINNTNELLEKGSI